MDPELQEKADQRFQEALEETGARDPREFYRERLRELKARSQERYDEAVTYYQDTLVPRVASGDGDPMEEWLEYGRKLAELQEAGRTVVVDRTGRSQPYEPPPSEEEMILHLPRNRKEKALLVGLPRDLSSAQKAAYDLLVAGKQTLR